jgi:hypothetical protein
LPASIVVYGPSPSSASTPIATISGNNTGLQSPFTPAVDATGRLYVPNASSVTVYAPGANGNVAPIETVTGSETGIVDAQGVALDAQGHIYVAGENGILEFAAFTPGTQSGTPIATIVPAQSPPGSIGGPLCIAIGSGGVIYGCYQSAALGAFIDQFPAGTNSTTATPSGTLVGSMTGLFISAVGVAFDSSGRMYVSCFNGTSENVTTSVFSSTTGNPAPIATYFAGEAGPALNAAGDIALATSDDENQILIFPPFLPGSSQNGGNQSPLATLSVGVNGPAGLVYH